MPKKLFFLLKFAALILVIFWFVENNGDVIIEWMGYRIQTSVAFATLFLVFFIVLCTFFMQMLLWIKNSPKRYRQQLKHRKLKKGLTALSEGFAAIAAGDSKQANLLVKKANNNLDDTPLTKLLAAQTANLDGNRDLAQKHYHDMLEDKNKNKDTEIIAIKGLLLESRQDRDFAKALFLAEKAYNIRPHAPWIITILLDLYKKNDMWEKAKKFINIATKHKLITKEESRHMDGLVSYALYQECNNKNSSQKAEKLLNNAYNLTPEYIAIKVTYSDMLREKGKKNKAINILENQWRKTPHPDIANAYMDIFADEVDEKRMKQANHLLELYNAHPEGHVLVAKTALSCGQLGSARQHLKVALSHGETKNICLLMAELESMERANHEVVHYWRERAMLANEFSTWHCRVCDDTPLIWQVNCKKCKSFDSIEWRPVQVAVDVTKPEKLLNNS